MTPPAALVSIGSLNMDFVVSVERLPAPGETVMGGGFQMIPGGKGANQACALGRLARPGVPVRMVGRVGRDSFGDHLLASLAAAGVDASPVTEIASAPTGTAFIWVDRSGQNSIVVAPGANATMAEQDAEAAREALRGAAFALFQLETPLAAVAAMMRVAREEGVRVMLDPAPAQALPEGLLVQVDCLTPNESEACLLLGVPVRRIDAAEAREIATALRARGPKVVVLKLGDRGSFWHDGERSIHTPSVRVEAADTTAAGDVFNAALAVALSEGQEVEEALRFANRAAAVSVTRLGAQASIPERDEVEVLTGHRPA